MSGEVWCGIPEHELLGQSHYHCGNCGEPSSMLGHSRNGEFTCTPATPPVTAPVHPGGERPGGWVASVTATPPPNIATIIHHDFNTGETEGLLRWCRKDRAVQPEMVVAGAWVLVIQEGDGCACVGQVEGFWDAGHPKVRPAYWIDGADGLLRTPDEVFPNGSVFVAATPATPADGTTPQAPTVDSVPGAADEWVVEVIARALTVGGHIGWSMAHPAARDVLAALDAARAAAGVSSDR